MNTKIFVNLPVKNLSKSIAFFTQLGYGFNPQFTDDKAGCMLISDDICVMLVSEEFFKTFIKKEICDSSRYAESITCLTANSKAEVDEMVAKAVKGGAKTPVPPQDHGFMYQHGFEDLDGHLWEYFYMDPSAMQSS